MAESLFERMKKAHSRQRRETQSRLRNQPVEAIEREEELRAGEEAEKQRLERIARHAARSFTASVSESLVARILNEVSLAVKDAVAHHGVVAAQHDAYDIAEIVAQRLAQVLVAATPSSAPVAAPRFQEVSPRIPILDIQRIVDYLLEKEAGGKRPQGR